MGFLGKTAEGVSNTFKELKLMKILLYTGIGVIGAGVTKIVAGLFGMKAASGMATALGASMGGIGKGLGAGAAKVASAIGLGGGAAKVSDVAGDVSGAATSTGSRKRGGGIGRSIRGGISGAATALKTGRIMPAALLGTVAGGIATANMDDDNPLKGLVAGGTTVLGMSLTGAAAGSVIPVVGTIGGAVIGAIAGLLMHNWDSIKGFMGGENGAPKASEIMDRFSEKGGETGGKIGSLIGRFVGKMVGATIGGAAVVGGAIHKGAMGLTDIAVNTWTRLTDWWKGNEEESKPGIIDRLKVFAGNMWDMTKGMWEDTLGWFSEKKEWWDNLEIIEPVMEKMKSGISAVANFFNLCDWICGVKRGKPDKGDTTIDDLTDSADGFFSRLGSGIGRLFNRDGKSSNTSSTNNRNRISIGSGDYYGTLSSQYESRGDSGAHGYDKVGGHSYGKYQFASNTGAMGGFLDYLKTEDTGSYKQLMEAGGEQGARRGTGAFRSAWKRVSQSTMFQNAEKGYIKTNYYQKIADNLRKKSKFDPDTRSIALKNVLWSTAVQHGPDTSVPHRVIGKTGLDAMDPEIIDGIYKERATRFRSSTPSTRKAVLNRFEREREQALAMWSQEQAQASLVGMGEMAVRAEGNVAQARRGYESMSTAHAVVSGGGKSSDGSDKMIGVLEDGTNATKEMAESTKNSEGLLGKIVALMEERNQMDHEGMAVDEQASHAARKVAARRRHARSGNPFIVAEPSTGVDSVLRGS